MQSNSSTLLFPQVTRMGHANRVDTMELYWGMVTFVVCVMALSLCLPWIDALTKYLEDLRHRINTEPSEGKSPE